MKITKIKQQTKNKNRYSIYINDEFAFGISEETLIYFTLHKNQVLSERQIQEIKQKEYEEKIYTQATNYLSYGLRSIKEMYDYLKRLELDQQTSENEHSKIDDNLINLTIEKLIKQGYLNDQIYAESYVRTQAHINRKGTRNIYHELIQRGINVAIIDEALREYPLSTQIENGIELANKYLKSNKKYPPKIMQQRLQQYLLRRGYDYEILEKILSEINLERSDEDLLALLELEGDKILRKRQRRFKGYELRQRTMNDLLRRGFDYELINDWIMNNEDVFKEGDE